MKHSAQAFVREACRFLESLTTKGVSVTAHLLVYWNQLKFDKMLRLRSDEENVWTANQIK